MADLFRAPEALVRIPMCDAEVFYQRHLPLSEPPEVVLRQLLQTIPWRAETIVLWGKPVPQPRLISWHGDAGTTYTYSGLRLDPLPWTPALLGIKHRIEAVVGHTFNSVLVNYYRDQRDSMGLHSDDEPELGRQPLISFLLDAYPLVS